MQQSLSAFANASEESQIVYQALKWMRNATGHCVFPRFMGDVAIYMRGFG
jgi:hypothetical protein